MVAFTTTLFAFTHCITLSRTHLHLFSASCWRPFGENRKAVTLTNGRRLQNYILPLSIYKQLQGCIEDYRYIPFKRMNALSNKQPLTSWQLLICVGRLTRQEAEAKTNTNRCPPKPENSDGDIVSVSSSCWNERKRGNMWLSKKGQRWKL